MMDALEPNCQLSGQHQGPVLSLAWNAKQPNHLVASGGADCSIRLWDLTMARSFTKTHKDKVQALAWNPAESSVLLSGSFDGNAVVVDCREENKKKAGLVFPVQAGEVESVVWDIHNPAVFGCSTDQGVVCFFDCRKEASPLLRFQAHDKACSQITNNKRVPGLYATCSADRNLKLWDLDLSIHQKQPQPVSSKRMKAGKLFSCQFSANVDFESRYDAFLIAAGGSKGNVALWHCGGDEEDGEDAKFVQAFKPSRVLPEPKRW